MDWTLASYSVPSGIHTLRWIYVKDGSGYSGDDSGWVDFVQWTGPSPQQDPAEWQEITYKHDLLGRRVEKKVDGYSTRYVYDGAQVIAEYDGSNNLLRKYMYGPGIDQPVCMIEVADANATYYYHYDALGSVVALSDSDGDTVQTCEYSVYGEVAVEDANHTNPYMFAGRRFDIEIGLYYNRARYYNPYTGRFLQTDPIGYGDGMNMYAYCTNNPLAFVDPTGCWASYSHEWLPTQGGDTWHPTWRLMIVCRNEDGSVGTDFYFTDWEAVLEFYQSGGDFCDVSFDRDDFLSWLGIAAFSDSSPPTAEEYYKRRTKQIIANVEESASRYVQGVREFGEFDFRFKPNEGPFILPDGTIIYDGSEFGNYLAGYGAYYHFGVTGILPVHLAGDIDGVIENLAIARTRWVDVFLGQYSPPSGTWLDDWESNRDINHGIWDAMRRTTPWLSTVPLDWETLWEEEWGL